MCASLCEDQLVLLMDYLSGNEIVLKKLGKSNMYWTTTKHNKVQGA